jgi:DNA-binding Lrp family transcriptional regulator
MQNYQNIKHKTLDSFLLKKSTASLSKKMDYSFDKVKRWKNGTKQLRWNEFCDLCEKIKAPLPEALLSVLGFSMEHPKDAYKIVRHLRYFSPEKSNEVLAQKMGISLSVLQRYIAAKTYPDLESILEMIDARPGFLDSFLEALAPVKKAKFENSAFNIPWFGAVSNAAALKAHQDLPEHSSEWIAQQLGLSLNQVEEALELMIALGLITKQGAHYGPTLSRTLSLNKQMNPLEYATFISFWIDRSKARYQTATGEPINKNNAHNCDIFRTFASSPTDALKISEIIKKADLEIHDLLQKSKGEEKTDVRVFLFHHFSAQDFAKV